MRYAFVWFDEKKHVIDRAEIEADSLPAALGIASHDKLFRTYLVDAVGVTIVPTDTIDSRD